MDGSRAFRLQTGKVDQGNSISRPSWPHFYASLLDSALAAESRDTLVHPCADLCK